MGVVVHRHEWSPTICTIHADIVDGYNRLYHRLAGDVVALVCANDRCRRPVHHDGKCDDSPARAEPAVYVVDAALIDNLRAAVEQFDHRTDYVDPAIVAHRARAVVDNARPHSPVDPA